MLTVAIYCVIVVSENKKVRQYKRVAALLYLRRCYRHLHNGKLRTVREQYTLFRLKKQGKKGVCYPSVEE